MPIVKAKMLSTNENTSRANWDWNYDKYHVVI